MDQLEGEFEYGAFLPGLLLHGASATGKTTSAYTAIERTLDLWHPGRQNVPAVIAARATELGRTISELSRGNGEELRDFVNRLRKTKLLFIDDLDEARLTPRVESELFDLLEYRETEDLPVVVTTNVNGRELEKLFSRNIGPAIVNRLRRICIAIDFDQESFDGAAALAVTQFKLREKAAAAGAAYQNYCKS
jgi:DNA replication protein DnaC